LGQIINNLSIYLYIFSFEPLPHGGAGRPECKNSENRSGQDGPTPKIGFSARAAYKFHLYMNPGFTYIDTPFNE